MAFTTSVLGSTAAAGVATAGIVLNPVAKSTTVILSVLTSASTTQGLVSVEYSLDDPTITPTPTTVWSLLSSAAAIASSVIAGGSPATGSLSWTVLSPIAQVRINSTAGSTGVGPPTYTLKALQSITA